MVNIFVEFILACKQNKIINHISYKTPDVNEHMRMTGLKKIVPVLLYTRYIILISFEHVLMTLLKSKRIM